MTTDRTLDYVKITGPGVDALERREPSVMAGEYLRQAELALTVKGLTVEGYQNAATSALNLIKAARVALSSHESGGAS